MTPGHIEDYVIVKISMVIDRISFEENLAINSNDKNSGRTIHQVDRL